MHFLGLINYSYEKCWLDQFNILHFYLKQNKKSPFKMQTKPSLIMYNYGMEKSRNKGSVITGLTHKDCKDDPKQG